MISSKFLAAGAAISALSVAPVAIGATGASATATPSHVALNKSVQLKVTGLKPAEKIKATELIPATGQKRTT